MVRGRAVVLGELIGMLSMRRSPVEKFTFVRMILSSWTICVLARNLVGIATLFVGDPVVELKLLHRPFW